MGARLGLALAVLCLAVLMAPMVTASSAPAPRATVTAGPLATPAFDGNPCGHPARDDPSCPTWNRCSRLASCTGDAPDPTIIKAGAAFLAISTGTPLGNSLQVLVSDHATSGYHAWPMGQCPTPGGSVACRLRYGSSAFGIDGRQGLPSWTLPGTQLAPAAAFLDGRWVLYFAGRSASTGRYCLGVAVLDERYAGRATAIRLPTDPTSPPLFIAPPTSTGPLRCEPPSRFGRTMGLVDPSVFVDPVDGTPWLAYKANDGSSPLAAVLLAQQLTPDGLHLTGKAHLLLTQDSASLLWEATIENPEMVQIQGRYRLLFSAGLWNTAGYSEAMATCTGPSGPCRQPNRPFLTSTPTAVGPGGGSVLTVDGTLDMAVAAWNPTCVGYPGQSTPSGCSTGARRLFVVPLEVSGRPR